MSQNDALSVAQWIAQNAYWQAQAIKALEFHEKMNK